MAQNEPDVIITNMAATGYNADASATKGGYVINGHIGLDPQKNLIRFDGEAYKDNALVCRFNSYQYGTPGGEVPALSYNLSDIRDISLAAGALIAIGDTAIEIQAMVKDENE